MALPAPPEFRIADHGGRDWGCADRLRWRKVGEMQSAARNMVEAKVASLTPGTHIRRLWLLPSGPDQVHHPAMRGDPPSRMLSHESSPHLKIAQEVLYAEGRKVAPGWLKIRVVLTCQESPGLSAILASARGRRWLAVGPPNLSNRSYGSNPNLSCAAWRNDLEC